ncbi:hypothetical protein Cgig2_009862 [Carnegiea gigantea]|uniref:BED-type domain-containing protein n=1 Tax=Carnegiea gigantea TaxID=171969 RepID=A0A9Q1QKE1_9CARY|nr:hypothetical protein Cgig2_009862 [Carnegiea gigantea]
MAKNGYWLTLMDSGSQSETVSTPTPLTDPNPSPSPPVSSAAQRPPRPPCGRGGRSLFAEVNEQIDEVDPYDFPAASRGKKRTSWVLSEFDLEGEGTGDEKACCVHCKDKLSAKSSHGTKHLSDHLLRRLKVMLEWRHCDGLLLLKICWQAGSGRNFGGVVEDVLAAGMYPNQATYHGDW